MNDNYQSRKNVLQWGLRILPLETYYALLKQYTVNLSPDAKDIIRKAQNIKKGKIWWWQWLCCEVLKEKKWVNIATGRSVSDWRCNKIGAFTSWGAYTKFREALREATAQHLRNNPQFDSEYRK